MHEVLVNRLGGLSLPRESVVRLTDRPDMTLEVYLGRKTTMQQQQRLTPIPGCLRLGLSWFNWWVSFAPEFQCCYFFESSCFFHLSFNFDFYVSKIMHL